MKHLLNPTTLQLGLIPKTKRILLMMLFVGIGVSFNSCTKEGGEGNIKVSISYTAPDNPNYTLYLSSGFTVKLSKDGSVIATQQTNGPGTIDLGTYDYGNYSVNVTGTEGQIVHISGNNYPDHNSLDWTKAVTLDDKTVTVSFSR